MLTAGEITDMRATSAAALPDTCRITRQTGAPVLDPVTGDNDYPAPTVVYDGPCRVRPQESQEQEAQVGDLHATTTPYVVTVPHDAAAADGGPHVDDFVELTASSDTSVIGRTFRILHVGWSSWQIDRRLSVEDREHSAGEDAP